MRSIRVKGPKLIETEIDKAITVRSIDEIVKPSQLIGNSFHV